MRARATEAASAVTARERHPTSAWRPDRARFRARMTERLAGEGCQWPEFVAAVLQTRARLGVDRAGLAELLGVKASVVDDLEEGRLPPSHAPLALTRLAPDVDWAVIVDCSSG